MLEKLTAKQEKLLPIIRDKRINKLNNPQKLDKVKSKEFIEWLYEFSGLKKPIIIFLDSPLGAQYSANMMKKLGEQVQEQVGHQVQEQVRGQVRGEVRDQVGGQVRRQVRGQVGNQVGRQVGNQVGRQVIDQVRLQVGGQVRDQVGGQVGGQVRDQVSDQVGGQVRRQVRGQVSDQVRGQVGNQVGRQVGNQVIGQVGGEQLEYFSFSDYANITDFGWLSFYEFFQSIGILKHYNFEKYIKIFDCNIYDMIQLDGLCIVCGMPEFVKRDDIQRMHSVDGPAIKRADGYELYYIHGVPFEKDVFDKFTKKELTQSEILNWENQDQKRAMIMETDYAELLVGATIVDTGVDGSGYQMNLYKIDLKDDKNPALFYEAIDPSKGEKIILRVHPTEVKTCMEAKLWTWKFLWDMHQEKKEIEFIKET